MPGRAKIHSVVQQTLRKGKFTHVWIGFKEKTTNIEAQNLAAAEAFTIVKHEVEREGNNIVGDQSEMKLWGNGCLTRTTSVGRTQTPENMAQSRKEAGEETNL